jgi:DNA (cytosine-5)-methyltransferase 1
MKPRALDLFSGAGGAAKGLQRAGFYVVGVDVRPQPRYSGDEFHQSDAMSFPIEGFGFVWASPPCQKYTRMNQGLLQSQGRGREHPDLIAELRRKLRAAGVPYVIENVIGAPLENAVMLCGSSFGLMVQRHRLFEANFPLLTPSCAHHEYVADKPPLHQLYGRSKVVGCYGNGRGKGDDVSLWRRAMGISWMTRKELSQAIPPAYSEFIARNYFEVANG